MANYLVQITNFILQLSSKYSIYDIFVISSKTTTVVKVVLLPIVKNHLMRMSFYKQ
ncbi:hypothetical protein NSTCB13_01942 [Nostoc sp. DSM 114160]|jgi:hypothetical protein